MGRLTRAREARPRTRELALEAAELRAACRGEGLATAALLGSPHLVQAVGQRRGLQVRGPLELRQLKAVAALAGSSGQVVRPARRAMGEVVAALRALPVRLRVPVVAEPASEARPASRAQT
jgi:hypothetical protein